MRRLIYIAILCAILGSPIRAQFANTLPSNGLRDTALLMLREFVLVGGDHKVGFTPANVMQAYIDTLSPVTFYYIGGDSNYHSTNPKGMSILVHVNKVMYPVMINGRICGSISFGNGHGRWSVREFQDSVEMIVYKNIMALLKPVSNGSNQMMAAYLPAINQTVLLQGDSAQVVVTSTSIGDSTKTKSLSGSSLEFLNKPQMPYEEFMQQYSNHIALKQRRKKMPLKH